ncbi:unnamed protein product, partial [Discosporangium mesarthrocarpum]
CWSGLSIALHHGSLRRCRSVSCTLNGGRALSFGRGGRRPGTLHELVASLPPIFPHDLHDEIRRNAAAVGRVMVVLDDDPTGTQTVHSVPVLTEWTVDSLANELRDVAARKGVYPIIYLNTNSRALPGPEAFSLYENIAGNLREACGLAEVPPVAVVSRGDSTLRGHFPEDLIALERGLGKRHDAWIIAPFFRAGGRVTAGDTHYVVDQSTSSGAGGGGGALIPAGETEFARDPAFGYRSSDLGHWVREKWALGAGAGAGLGVGVIPGDQSMPGHMPITSVSLEDLRVGGTEAVRGRLREAGGGYVIVNAVEERDLQVFVSGLVLEELEGASFLFRTAADFVAVRGGVDPKPLLGARDFERQALVAGGGGRDGGGGGGATVAGGGGGLVVVGSYVKKSTQQLEHALETVEAQRVELRVPLVRGGGGRNVYRGEVERVRNQTDSHLSQGHDVVLHTSRGVLGDDDGAGGLVSGASVSRALTEVVGGLRTRPRFLVAKGGITSSDVATGSLGMRRAEVMGQILPGVPVWSMGGESRWPGLPYVVFPGNVGGREALAEAMVKVKKMGDGGGGGGLRFRVRVRVRHGVEQVHPYGSSSGARGITLEILGEAAGRGAAVGAFTVYTLEGVRAVVEAAEATGRPAILQVSL